MDLENKSIGLAAVIKIYSVSQLRQSKMRDINYTAFKTGLTQKIGNLLQQSAQALKKFV